MNDIETLPSTEELAFLSSCFRCEGEFPPNHSMGSLSQGCCKLDVDGAKLLCGLGESFKGGAVCLYLKNPSQSLVISA